NLVHIILRQHHPQPASQRSTSRVECQFGTPLLTGPKSVELRIQRVGQFATNRFIASNAASGLIDRLPEPGEKYIPCMLISGSAALGEHQFLETQIPNKIRYLGFGSAGQVLSSRDNGLKDRGQMFRGDPEFRPSAARIHRSRKTTENRRSGLEFCVGVNHEAYRAIG